MNTNQKTHQLINTICKVLDCTKEEALDYINAEINELSLDTEDIYEEDYYQEDYTYTY